MATTGVVSVALALGVAAPPAQADAGTEAAGIAAAIAKATAGMASERPAQAGTAAGTLVSTSSTATVTLPRSGRDGVLVTGKYNVKIGLPTEAMGTRTSVGTVVYADTRRDGDVAVQSLGGGSLRVLVTLADRSAPGEYRFPLSLPAGAHLVPNSDGSVYIMTMDEAAVLGKIQAPWATDAAGVSVPTSYRIEGTTIVQTVRTSDRTIFPVVADPTFGWDWTPPGPAAYFNKHETAVVADTEYWELVGIIAGYLASSPAMAAAAAVQIWHIKGWAQRAKREGKCLKLILYLGLIEGETYTGGNCR